MARLIKFWEAISREIKSEILYSTAQKAARRFFGRLKATLPNDGECLYSVQ